MQSPGMLLSKSCRLSVVGIALPCLSLWYFPYAIMFCHKKLET